MINLQSSVDKEEPPQQQTFGKIFRRGVFFTGAGSVITLVSLFLETMIAVRVLSTESYGIYVLLIAVVNFFVTCVDFGCKATVTQFIASSEQSQKTILAQSTLFFRLLVIIIVSVLIWLLRDALLFLDPSGELVHYTAYIPLMLAVASLDELFQAELQGFQIFKHMALSQIIRGLFRLCLSIVFLVVLKLGVMSLIYSWLISFIISSGYQYLVLPVPKRLVWNYSLMREMLRFGFPIQLDRFLWYLSSRVDVLLLSFFIGPAAVAFLNIAATIPGALIRLAESFVAVFYPTMATLLAEGKYKQANWMLNQSIRLCSFIGALAALGAVLFSKEIITLLFSEKYTSSNVAFSFLMISFHMMFLLNIIGYTLTAAGFPKRSLGQNTIRVISVVVGDLLLIPIFSFLGSAIASVISTYLTNPAAVWLLRRTSIQLKLQVYIKQTLLLWLCSLLFWWLQPAGIIYKLGFIILYVVLNVMLATISIADLKLLLPDAVTKRLHFLRETLPNDR